MSLANNEFLNLEIVAKKNIHNCLTFLTYTSQKNEIESENIKSKFKK